MNNYPCQFQLVQSLWRRFLQLLFVYGVQQAKEQLPEDPASKRLQLD